MCWKNGEVFVTSPDMIQIIDSKTGQPYTNNVIEVGMEVSVIAMKARDIFRTPVSYTHLSRRSLRYCTSSGQSCSRREETKVVQARPCISSSER